MPPEITNFSYLTWCQIIRCYELPHERTEVVSFDQQFSISQLPAQPVKYPLASPPQGVQAKRYAWHVILGKVSIQQQREAKRDLFRIARKLYRQL